MRTQVWYNPDLVSAYNMVPAMIGMILLFLTMQLTAAAIVRERERGTMEQLAVTPLTSAELMIGKLAPFVVIAMIDTVEIVVVGVLVFNVPINGSLVLLFALFALFLVTTLGIGLFISTIARTQREAQMTSMLFTLPAMFLSGFYFPYRRDAEVAAVRQLCDSAALFPDHRAQHRAQRRGRGRARPGDRGVGDLRRTDHRRWRSGASARRWIDDGHYSRTTGRSPR